MCPGEITWFKRGRTLDTIKIIVESRGTCNEEWCRDTNEVDVFFEVVFESRFAEGESFLELEAVGEGGLVAAVEAVCSVVCDVKDM